MPCCDKASFEIQEQCFKALIKILIYAAVFFVFDSNLLSQDRNKMCFVEISFPPMTES